MSGYRSIVRTVLNDGAWHTRQELLLALLEQVPAAKFLSLKMDGRYSKANLPVELRLKNAVIEVLGQTMGAMVREGLVEAQAVDGKRRPAAWRIRRSADEQAIEDAVARAAATR